VFVYHKMQLDNQQNLQGIYMGAWSSLLTVTQLIQWWDSCEKKHTHKGIIYETSDL